MENILDKICNNIKSKYKEEFEKFSLKDYNLIERTPIDVLGKLKSSSFFVISEVKKGSPSKGVIKENFKPVEIAKEYEKAGASAISVLTEEDYFFGSKEYLKNIRDKVRLPLLRKDFIVHVSQIYEAYNLGADLVLLIVAVLDDKELLFFKQEIEKLGMMPLIEVHNREELERALKVSPKLIGINNRDLKTFNVDINTTLNLKKIIPKDIFVISESGIKTRDDIEMLKNNGINGVLIGETLMRADNISNKFEELFG